MFGRKKEQTKATTVVVANLDKMVEKKYSIVIHGKEHIVQAPSIENWLEIVSSSSNLLNLQTKEHVSKDELVEHYFDFVHRMCPTITKEDIVECKKWQLGALWQICVDMMNGYDEKKSLATMVLMGMTKEEITKMIMVLQSLLSTHPESLPTSAESSAGR